MEAPGGPHGSPPHVLLLGVALGGGNPFPQLPPPPHLLTLLKLFVEQWGELRTELETASVLEPQF